MADIIDYYNPKTVNNNTAEATDLIPETPFANNIIQQQDPMQSYLQLLQGGNLPDNYGQLQDPRSMLPQGTFQTNEEGRTMYQMPTVGKEPNTPYSQEVLQAFLKSEEDGTPFEHEWSKGVDLSTVNSAYGATVKAPKVFQEWEEARKHEADMNEALEDYRAFEDVEAIQELGPENAQNLRNLATVSLRLLAKEDKESKEYGQYILHLMKDYDPFHILLKNETGGQSTFADIYKAPKEHGFWAKQGLGILSALAPAAEFGSWARKVVLEISDGNFSSAGARLVRGGLNAAGEIGDIFAYMAMPPLALVKAGEVALSKWDPDNPLIDKIIDPVMSFAGNPIGSITNKLEKGITASGLVDDDWHQYDANQDGIIDYLEMFKDPDWGKGGFLGDWDHRLVNFLGMVATDPISYATFGMGGVAKRTTGMMKSALEKLQTSSKGVEGLYRNLGDAPALAAEKAARAHVLVARALNREPLTHGKYVKFSNKGDDFVPMAGDKETLHQLLQFARLGEDGATSLANNQPIKTLINQSTWRQARSQQRSIDRLMKRGGGGIFASHPSTKAAGKGLGMRDHLVPGTRGLYQAVRKLGVREVHWKAFTNSMPTFLNKYRPEGFAKLRGALNTYNSTLTKLQKASWGTAIKHADFGDLTSDLGPIAFKVDDIPNEVAKGLKGDS